VDDIEAEVTMLRALTGRPAICANHVRMLPCLKPGKPEGVTGAVNTAFTVLYASCCWLAAGEEVPNRDVLRSQWGDVRIPATEACEPKRRCFSDNRNGHVGAQFEHAWRRRDEY